MTQFRFNLIYDPPFGGFLIGVRCMDKVFFKGINDAPYETQKFIKVSDNKWKLVWICPFYKTWKHMLERCFCNKLKSKYPTYKDVTVCEEWLYFSNFKAWMEQQDWEGKALDKDLLIEGNKVYSPETCIFIPKALNNFLTNTQRTKKSKLPIGVCWNKDHGKFQVRCNNPFTKKRENLGYFNSLDEASFAWKNRKLELAKEWAYRIDDIIIQACLLSLDEDRWD